MVANRSAPKKFSKKLRFILICCILLISVPVIIYFIPHPAWEIYTNNPNIQKSSSTINSQNGTKINLPPSTALHPKRDNQIENPADNLFFQVEIPYKWQKNLDYYTVYVPLTTPAAGKSYPSEIERTKNSFFGTAYLYNDKPTRCPLCIDGPPTPSKLSIGVISTSASSSANGLEVGHPMQSVSSATVGEIFEENMNKSHTEGILGGEKGYLTDLLADKSLYVKHGDFIVFLHIDCSDSSFDCKTVWDHAIETFKFLN